MRVAGLPIKGFGGISSGPEPLKKLHQEIRQTLELSVGQPLSVTAIVDLMNFIGRCVVSGNVRRQSESIRSPTEQQRLPLAMRTVKNTST